MTIERLLSVAALVGVIAGVAGGYKVMEYRLEIGDAERAELRGRVEEINGILHRRITRNADAIQSQREEALKRVGEVETKLTRLDAKIDRNHTETSARLDLLLERMGAGDPR